MGLYPWVIQFIAATLFSREYIRRVWGTRGLESWVVSGCTYTYRRRFKFGNPCPTRTCDMGVTGLSQVGVQNVTPMSHAHWRPTSFQGLQA